MKSPYGYEMKFDDNKFYWDGKILYPREAKHLSNKELAEKAKKEEQERKKKEAERIKEIYKNIGKRLLVYRSTYSQTDVVEKSIIEISPSGNYGRVMDEHGKKEWVTPSY